MALCFADPLFVCELGPHRVECMSGNPYRAGRFREETLFLAVLAGLAGAAGDLAKLSSR